MKRKVINMRCTLEQFESIERELRELGVNFNDALFNLKDYPYLTNGYNASNCKGIGSRSRDMIPSNQPVYDAFDGKEFLKVCRKNALRKAKVYNGTELQFKRKGDTWTDCTLEHYSFRVKPKKIKS